MPERESKDERFFARIPKTARRLVGLSTIATTVACSPASCAPNEPQAAPEKGVMTDCRVNGDLGDTNSRLVTPGEAVTIFPGTVEVPGGEVYVRPLVKLGALSVLSTYTLTYNSDVEGFTINPVSLKDAIWKLDTTIGAPGKPADMTAKDQCIPYDVTGRAHTPAQWVVLDSHAETRIVDTPGTNGQAFNVPMYAADTDGAVSVGQWLDAGVFGQSLDEQQAIKLRNGTPMARVEISLVG